MSDTNKERLNAIREAWKNERTLVREGNGTRDWSQAEQRQIVAKGRANGYEGHHMKSVRNYPQHAGNPQNIQFLNRAEHINGAHKGNPQNPTNGYYNPKTGTMNNFGNRNPQSPQSQPLSKPLTQRQQNIAIKGEQARLHAARQAKSEVKQPVSKQTLGNNQTFGTQSVASGANKGIESYKKRMMSNQTAPNNIHQSSQNKGIEAARQRTKVSQLKANTGKSSNQGIKNYKVKATGQPSGVASSRAKSVVGSSGGKANTSQAK